MARGSTLARTLLLVKREIRASLSAGAADDALLLQAIEVAQEEIAAAYDWGGFSEQWGITTSTRWTAFPTAGIGGSNTGINFDRDVEAWVRHNEVWQQLDKGITLEHYNVQNPDDGDEQDPAQVWDYKPGAASYFELWPVPATTQEVRFLGQRKLTSLRTNGVLDQAKTLDFDDILIALFVAIDWLAGKKEAVTKQIRFQERLNRLRANDVQSDERIILGSGGAEREKPIILTIAGGSGGGVGVQENYDGIWDDPNGNITPTDQSLPAFYSKKGTSTPVLWRWDTVDLVWYAIITP